MIYLLFVNIMEAGMEDIILPFVKIMMVHGIRTMILIALKLKKKMFVVKMHMYFFIGEEIDGRIAVDFSLELVPREFAGLPGAVGLFDGLGRERARNK